MLDQAAQIRVMDGLRSRRAAIPKGDLRIVQHALQQALQMRVADRATIPRSSFHIASGSRFDDGK